jgi:hypothetical protein
MKTVTILAIVWLCFAPIEAQQIIEKQMNFSGKESLSLKIQIADSINVQTWNKDEVYVKASVNINENKDNEAYVTSFDEVGKTLTVNANFRDKYFKGRNNCCNKTDIFWQVFIPEKVRFSVETINADVTITGQTSSMNIKNISGYIDLAVPADKKADLEFSTVTGKMYSNHELALNKTHSGIPSKIAEKLNNGGALIKLETISGDIYFRKSVTN